MMVLKIFTLSFLIVCYTIVSNSGSAEAANKVRRKETSATTKSAYYFDSSDGRCKKLPPDQSLASGQKYESRNKCLAEHPPKNKLRKKTNSPARKRVKVKQNPKQSKTSKSAGVVQPPQNRRARQRQPFRKKTQATDKQPTSKRTSYNRRTKSGNTRERVRVNPKTTLRKKSGTRTNKRNGKKVRRNGSKTASGDKGKKPAASFNPDAMLSDQPSVNSNDVKSSGKKGKIRKKSGNSKVFRKRRVKADLKKTADKLAITNTTKTQSFKPSKDKRPTTGQMNRKLRKKVAIGDKNANKTSTTMVKPGKNETNAKVAPLGNEKLMFSDQPVRNRTNGKSYQQDSPAMKKETKFRYDLGKNKCIPVMVMTEVPKAAKVEESKKSDGVRSRPGAKRFRKKSSDGRKARVKKVKIRKRTEKSKTRNRREVKVRKTRKRTRTSGQQNRGRVNTGKRRKLVKADKNGQSFGRKSAATLSEAEIRYYQTKLFDSEKECELNKPQADEAQVARSNNSTALEEMVSVQCFEHCLNGGRVCHVNEDKFCNKYKNPPCRKVPASEARELLQSPLADDPVVIECKNGDYRDCEKRAVEHNCFYSKSKCYSCSNSHADNFFRTKAKTKGLLCRKNCFILDDWICKESSCFLGERSIPNVAECKFYTEEEFQAKVDKRYLLAIDCDNDGTNCLVSTGCSSSTLDHCAECDNRAVFDEIIRRRQIYPLEVVPGNNGTNPENAFRYEIVDGQCVKVDESERMQSDSPRTASRFGKSKKSSRYGKKEMKMRKKTSNTISRKKNKVKKVNKKRPTKNRRQKRDVELTYTSPEKCQQALNAINAMKPKPKFTIQNGVCVPTESAAADSALRQDDDSSGRGRRTLRRKSHYNSKPSRRRGNSKLVPLRKKRNADAQGFGSKEECEQYLENNCEDGKVYDKNIKACVFCPPDKMYDPDTKTCVEKICKDGYKKLGNGTCVLDCKEGEIVDPIKKMCVPEEVPDCPEDYKWNSTQKQCLDDNGCTEDTAYYNEFGCLPRCDELGQIWNDENECEACPEDYVPNKDANECLPVEPEGDEGCDDLGQIWNDEGNCEACPAGSVPNDDSDKCVPVKSKGEKCPIQYGGKQVCVTLSDVSNCEAKHQLGELVVQKIDPFKAYNAMLHAWNVRQNHSIGAILDELGQVHTSFSNEPNANLHALNQIFRQIMRTQDDCEYLNRQGVKIHELRNCDFSECGNGEDGDDEEEE